MADFSSCNMNPFLVDSFYLSGLMEDESNMSMNTNGFSQICLPEAEPPCPVVHEIISRSLDHSSKMGPSHEDNVSRKQSSGSSTVVDKLERVSPIVKKRSPNSAQSKECAGKKKQKQCNGEGKDEEAASGYIHVRARRGEATDSHSLAERVRREKISERMQILQKLVPGCDKVTGKAMMLDEIINYVQSLQNQVEFLSVKLASMNPMFYDLIIPQQQQPNDPTVFAHSFNNPSAFSQEHGFQDNATVLWDVEEELGDKFLNP